MECPKCHHTRTREDTAPDTECPRCGVIYAKAVPRTPRQARIPQSTPAITRREVFVTLASLLLLAALYTFGDRSSTEKAPALARSSSTPAVSPQTIDRLTTYAVLIGRATACDANGSEAFNRVERWFNSQVPPESALHQVHWTIFLEGMRHHMRLQRDGLSPDNCSEVLRVFHGIRWP